MLGSVVTRGLEARCGIRWAYVIGCIVFPLPLVLVPLAGGPAPVILGMLFARCPDSGCPPADPDWLSG